MNLKITTVLLSLACIGVTFAQGPIPSVIYHGPSNEADFTVSQSSDYTDTLTHVADLALDGNTNGNGAPFASVSITTNTESNPWWKVEFETTKEITGVNIWNAFDTAQHYGGRLDGFTLTLLLNCTSENDPVPVYTYTHNPLWPAGDDPSTFDGLDNFFVDFTDMGEPTTDTGIKADSVVIQLPGPQYLTLAEVQVLIADTTKTPKSCKSYKEPKARKFRKRR